MDPTIQPVIEAIVAALSPRSIWLFGSRAEHRERPESDWDLLVVLPDGTSHADLDPIAAWKRFGRLGVPVDIVPCTQSEFDEERFEPDSLPAAAWKRGRCLYEHSETASLAGSEGVAIPLEKVKIGAGLEASAGGWADLLDCDAFEDATNRRRHGRREPVDFE